LGIGSGKTIFAKQMKILTCGFLEDDFKVHKEIILDYILVGIQELIKQAEILEYYLEGDNLKHCRYFTQLRSGCHWTEKMGEKIKLLWYDTAIQRSWLCSPRIQLKMAHLDYFMDNLDRISKRNYAPSNEDMLRIQLGTTDEQRTSFVIEKTGWDLIDVGQKPERAKWESIITSKESVCGIMFFADLDEYNIMSTDDNTKTKMEISLQVFTDLLTSQTLQDRPFITFFLFLNKTDILEAKLKLEEDNEKFKELFPNYKDGSIESACDCVKEKFLLPFPDMKIHTHYICALDTALMSDVFTAIRTTIFDTRLITSGVRIN